MALNDFNNDNKSTPIFSKAVKAGKRTYFIDVKQTKGGDCYIVITESKRILSNNPDQEATYEKHKIFLYKEDFEKFMFAMDDAIAFIHEADDDNSDREITE
ncbi:MAG: DUF3276 family protein [Bacteroidales bacterium]|nr:DUF3276 family protein [Bacteroidales bacterium]